MKIETKFEKGHIAWPIEIYDGQFVVGYAGHISRINIEKGELGLSTGRCYPVTRYAALCCATKAEAEAKCEQLNKVLRGE